MSKKHFISSTVSEIVDSETGEITRVENSKLVKVSMGKQEEFFMTYCNYLSSFYGLKYADDLKMMIKLNQCAQYDTGRVQLTPKSRLDITDELGIRADGISKSLKRLKEKGLIVGEKNDYEINPIVFWKGDRANRKKILEDKGLKLTLSFEMDKK